MSLVRYCRRCWPTAHRGAWRAYVAESVRGASAWLRWAEAAVGSVAPPEPTEASVPGFWAEWHWSVALGSLWRDHQESATWRKAARHETTS